MIKSFSSKALVPSKSLVIRINLVFLAVFFVIYVCVLLGPSGTSGSLEYPVTTIKCSLRECHHPKVEDGVVKMKAVLEEKKVREKSKKVTMVRREKPSFLNEMWERRSKKIGMVNMNEEEMSGWESQGKLVTVGFERVSKNLEWKHLFPEWIAEEEEGGISSCPEIPMPDFMAYDEMDMVVVKLPCEYPKRGWGRDVFRLQVHLIAANLAVKRGKRDDGRTMKMVFLSPCKPMMELFRCDDMVRREGDWWWYEPEIPRLEQKLSLPIGACKLSLPLWVEGSIDEVYNQSKIKADVTIRREAYATVLHSSEAYVCGAMVLAQSILATGTNRDLVILIDKTISQPKRDALAASGWKIRIIERIRNPKAQRNTYNEYNYSKLRLWQLTDYDKIIFIDADILVLKNMDILFQYPEMSARGNDGFIFNSGVMAIEPSNCTFKAFMDLKDEIVSYNGGDQGFLNEVFMWWHRWPKRVSYMKQIWSNTEFETNMKNQLFDSDPPKLYSIHFLGTKPWSCYRDYDCNWNIDYHSIFSNDVAHRRWWKVHDAMDEGLQRFCALTPKRKMELDSDIKVAREKGLQDGHWKINITDPRQHMLFVG